MGQKSNKKYIEKSKRNIQKTRSFRAIKAKRNQFKHNKKTESSLKEDKKTQKYYSNASKKFYDTIKEKLFEILGGKKCHSCGFRDQRALGFTLKGDPSTFDEIRRGGFAASWGKYISKPDLARKEIQILCLNCNAIREPKVKSNSKKEVKKKSKFFPRKENTNVSYDN